MTDFTHLHVHTEYSMLDGANNVGNLIKRAADLNMSSLAITDHGNLHGIIHFYEKALKNGIKPIIGEEFYLSPHPLDSTNEMKRKAKNYHLVLLAKNEKGLGNLYKLSSLGFTRGFRYRPRIDKGMLRKHSDGLVCLSACRGGEIQSNILNNDIDGAMRSAREYCEIFSKERFFLELMRIGLADDNRIIEGQMEIARELGIDVVATNDVHYLTKKDSLAHEILLCIQTGRTINDEDRFRFQTNEFYLKTPEEMSELFSDIPEALSNTMKVADMCNVKIDVSGKNFKMPRVELKEGFDNEDDYLEYLAGKGLEEKFPGEITPEVKKRYEYELSVIEKMNYAGYFIIIYNLIEMAKENNITIGPGRGSAAGSLILYLLGITKVNPLEYGLFFERFLNPERISMPDVDIDISDLDRDKLLNILTEKYHRENVALIATFGTLKSRQVFTDVARAFEVPPAEVKRITKRMPANAGLGDVYDESADFRKLVENDPNFKKIYDISLVLENNVRHVSKHAAGIVITPGPMTDYAPVFSSPGEQTNITQFEKDTLEKIGLVKMDLLGLRTLSVIDNTLDMLAGRDVEIDIDNLPKDDSDTFDTIRKGATAGVFQLESAGMRSFLRRYGPEDFNDIIKIISFYRPGPMQEMGKIINRKNGKEKVTYDHPLAEDILSETYGLMIYQEQVMSIANKIAGFSFAKADILRKAMSKKKRDLMNQYEKEFVEGAQAKGIDKRIALNIFEKIAKFAEYGFNKSHGTAYAFLSYQTAYLKTHYPLEFMASTINSYIGVIKKVVKYIEETKAMDIPILQPDINKSGFKVSVEGNGLRLGLGIIKNVGQSAVENIMKNRKDEPYKNFYDFLTRVDTKTVNKKAVESLIKAGAFDSLGKDRHLLLDNFPEILNRADKKKEKIEAGMLSLFGEESDGDWESMITVDKKWNKEKLLNFEFEVLEFFISGHPLEKYRGLYNSIVTHSLDDFNELDSDENVTMIGILNNISKKKARSGKYYSLFRLFTLEGYVACAIFNDTHEKYSPYLVKDSSVVVFGKTKRDDENTLPRIFVDKIIPLEEVRKYIDGVKLSITLDEMDEKMINDLRTFASSNMGNNHLIVQIKSKQDNTIRIKSKSLQIAVNSHNFSKLENIVGEGNVHYLFKQF
ncbi:MAG: DNA polymerase III subunit alpha [bacterium]